ncbi:MAG: short-chain dehydrogenase/reductase [Paenibacillus sp.]|jgi:NAD(P)-dependent dehydrogenase (short-subunit alcohol dehydrogenase family)|nr:short-chain dehydrogenase/reductase [Paenibacillus sp.]
MDNQQASGLQPLIGKRALVTGASTGIGKAIALALAAAGADVAVNDRIHNDGLDEVSSSIRFMGRLAASVTADVSDSQQVSRMFAELSDVWGGIDVLVNNAGISPAQPFLTFTSTELLAIIAINLSGAMLCAQQALPHMTAAGWGRIINISSVHSMANDSGRVPYAASKGGMNAMTRALAVEFGPQGICTNSLIVGAIATERTLMSPLTPQQLEAWSQAIPVGRWGTPEEISRMAAYLADPQSGFINGACIAMDGGGLSMASHP